MMYKLYFIVSWNLSIRRTGCRCQVIMAADRKDGAVREANEDEKLLRLFIKVPRTSTRTEINESFEVRMQWTPFPLMKSPYWCVC